MATYCHSSQNQVWSDSLCVCQSTKPVKGPSSGHLYPVSSVKERNQKGGKCKISQVLQSPVSSTQASPRWRPIMDLNRLNTLLHVEKFKMETTDSIRTSLIPGEWVSSIDLSDVYLHIPIQPNSRKYLRFCRRSQVFQFTSLPFRLATAPQVFTMIVKEVEANGPLQRTQTSPIPGRLADQVPVSGGSPSEHSGSGRPNPVLGLDNKSGKIRTETFSGVFVRGLRIPSKSSPCKTHSRDGPNFRI